MIDDRKMQLATEAVGNASWFAERFGFYAFGDSRFAPKLVTDGISHAYVEFLGEVVWDSEDDDVCDLRDILEKMVASCRDAGRLGDAFQKILDRGSSCQIPTAVALAREVDGIGKDGGQDVR